MNQQSVRKSMSFISLLLTCFSTSALYAQWNDGSALDGYNPGYGNFPPEDIEQRLFGQMNSEAAQNLPQNQNNFQYNAWQTPPDNQYTAPTSPPNRTQNYSQQNYSQQTDTTLSYPTEQTYQQLEQTYQPSLQPPYQQPQQYETSPYGAYPVAPQANNNRQNNRSMGLNNPWNNSNSSFSMPWGNNSSAGNMMPWRHNNMRNNSIGSNNPAATRNPWNNLSDGNSTSFTTPWNNKGSSFSMPWAGNNSGFGPLGN